MSFFRESLAGNINQSFKMDRYMEYLQDRNKGLLYDILSGEDVEDGPLISAVEKEDRETRRGRQAIDRVVKQVANLTGITSIMPLQQLGQVQGVIERAQERFFQDIRMQFAQVAIPLERFANDVVFRYESLINENYQLASVASMIGSAIGFYFLGPIGGAIGETIGGLAGATIQFLRNWYVDQLLLVPREDLAGLYEDLKDVAPEDREAFFRERILGEDSGTAGGGLPRTAYRGYHRIITRRKRPIIDMEQNLYANRRL